MVLSSPFLKPIFVFFALTSLAGFYFAQAASVGTAVVVISVIPNAPSNLTASASSQSQVDLSWTDNASNETGFSVERSLGDDTQFSSVGNVGANVSVYHDSGLVANTTYFYRVFATGSQGNSTSSNEASVTTPSVPLPPPGNGGGGGGGGGGPAPVFQTSAIFKGVAYPLSNVTLLENGQVVAVTQAGPDAKFEVDLSNISPGTYNFGVWAVDPAGNRSITQTFQVTLTTGATTVISGIFFPPTIGTDKIKVKRGDVVTVLGYAAPQAMVTVMVHSNNSIVKNVTSSDQGVWIYKLNTGLLDYGDHTASAHAAAGNDITTDSALITFNVGTENIASKPSQSCATTGNVNGDCKVNLVDFSIMAYWFHRPNPPAAIDINGDGVVNLIDFSILAYYWTG